MDEIEPLPEVRSPLHRVIAIASTASFVSLIFSFVAARWVVSQLQGWWVQLLVYAVIPVAVAFVILYRSCWHREIKGAARTCSLLLVSCAILAGDVIAVGAVICAAVVFICLIAFFVMSLRVTGGPG
jgi:hypothetical protein